MFEGKLSSEQAINCDTEAPNVRFRAVLLAGVDNLRRHVKFGPNCGVRKVLMFVADGSGASEVGNLDEEVFVEE